MLTLPAHCCEKLLSYFIAGFMCQLDVTTPGGQTFSGAATGSSKKAAENACAAIICQQLDQRGMHCEKCSKRDRQIHLLPKTHIPTHTCAHTHTQERARETEARREIVCESDMVTERERQRREKEKRQTREIEQRARLHVSKYGSCGIRIC